MSKTIIIIFHDLGLGGVQRKIVDVVERLRKNYERSEKYKIIIILEVEKNYDLDEDIFLEALIKNNCEVFYYRSRTSMNYGTLHIPFTLFVLRKIFKFKPDIILAFMEPYAVTAFICNLLYRLSTQGKIKIIVGFDNVATLLLKDGYANGWKFYYYSFLIRYLFNSADKIIVPSDYAKRDMENNFRIRSEKVFVNKNWITTARKHTKYKKKYDLLYVGRIDRVKNLKMFAKTVKKLSFRFPGIRACLVGWGDDIYNVYFEVKKLSLINSIVFVGSQKNVDHYYSRSKIFLLTSDYEGLPIVLLEAMSWKLPVVSVNYPGVEEVINNGKTGFVCKDKEALVERVNELLSNNEKIKKMGNMAKRYVVEHHGDNNLNNFVELILY